MTAHRLDCSNVLETTYGCSIIALTKVTVDTARRGGVDDAAVFLLQKDGPGSLGNLIGTTQMNVQDGVPEVVIHVRECLVPEDTGIVNDDVETAERINGALDDLLSILGGSFHASGLSAQFLDLSNDGIGIHKVVDHHGCPYLAKARLYARPIPAPPPVIKTTRPVKSNFSP